MDKANIKGDIFGGVTAGVVALPLALAFGVQSGMGAAAGLYGAIIAGILAAAFGGTPTQVTGPTGPMTVVSATIIASAIGAAGSLEAGLWIIIATFLFAGLFQILFGFLRIGKYVKYIPYPVISGFMSGIGVIIILLQVFPFFGYASPKSIIDVFLRISEPLSAINFNAVLLATATILVIYLFPRITRAIPSTLVALVLVTLAAVVLNLNVPIIGDIPSGIPSLQVGVLRELELTQFSIVIIPALTLAALGAIDSLLTSVVADNLTKTRHNSNRELIGQGIGNTVAALFGSIPSAGATMRTVVNINSGGKTRLSGIIHGVLLLVVLLGAGSLAAQIPLAVLAGILVTVGIGIIDYKGLKHLTHVPRADAVVMIVVLLLTVFVDLLQAVAIGMVLASVLFMKSMSDIVEQGTEVAPINEFQEDLPWEDEELIPKEIAQRIYIKHFYGPLFFGFRSRFQELISMLPDVDVIVMRMGRVPYIDQSGLYAIEDAVIELQRRDVAVIFTDVEDQPLEMLKKIDLVPNLVPEDYLFDDFEQCAKWIESYVRSRHGDLRHMSQEMKATTAKKEQASSGA